MSSGSCNPVDRGCVCPVLKDALAKKYVPETGRKEYPVGLVEEMAVDPLPRRKGEKDHRILGLQNESVLRETNSGAGVVGERAFPLKSGSFKLVNVARWDHPGTEGESEVKGMIGVAHRDSKREAMPRAIPCNLVCDLPSFGSVDTRRVFMCDVGLCDEGS